MPTYRPGTQVIVRSTPSPRSTPTNTGTGFFVGLSDKGSILAPIPTYSMDDFIRYCGTRQSYSVLYDAVEAFFREGGNQAWIGRVVGPAPVYAFRNLVDAVAATSLVVKANSPGSWGNSIKVAVIAGVTSGYAIQVTDSNNVVLELSPDLTTQQDAVTWATYSQYITVTIGASANAPVIGGANVLTALATGADDRNNITDTQWQNALNLFTKDLGPGNVAAPGRTASAGHLQLLAHAAANNRFAVLDPPDTATLATITAIISSDKAGLNGQYGGLWWPWINIPGIAAGTTRPVPPSGSVMGQMARMDALRGPNVAAAGNDGVLSYAVSLSQSALSDATRDTWNTAGINVIRPMLGTFRIFGYRTLADPVSNTDWLMANNVRLLMAVAAEADAIGQDYVFDQIDGRGVTIASYGGALTAMLARYWNTGQLYGATAAEAFSVDVGPTVNTPARLAAQELRAVIAVRPSPLAELVTIEIVNVNVTKAVA